MSDFKPYEKEKEYRIVVSQDELVLIQKTREVQFGAVKAMMSGGRITRIETSMSELTKDIEDTKVEIAFETIIEGN